MLQGGGLRCWSWVILAQLCTKKSEPRPNFLQMKVAGRSLTQKPSVKQGRIEVGSQMSKPWDFWHSHASWVSHGLSLILKHKEQEGTIPITLVCAKERNLNWIKRREKSVVMIPTSQTNTPCCVETPRDDQPSWRSRKDESFREIELRNGNLSNLQIKPHRVPWKRGRNSWLVCTYVFGRVCRVFNDLLVQIPGKIEILVSSVWQDSGSRSPQGG
jgi:hypothetical protein